MLPKTQSGGLHPLFLFSCPAPSLIFAELGSPVMAHFCYQSITCLLQIEAQRNGHILHTHSVSFGFPFHITMLISSKRSSDRQVRANHHGFYFFNLKTNVQHNVNINPKFKEGAEHRWVGDSAVGAGPPCHPSATSPLSSAACSIWLGSAGTALLLLLPSSIPSCQAVPGHQLGCSALGMPAAPASNTACSIQAQPPPCAVGLISWDKLPVFPSPLLLLPELCRLTRSCWNLEKSN